MHATGFGPCDLRFRRVAQDMRRSVQDLPRAGSDDGLIPVQGSATSAIKAEMATTVGSGDTG